MLKIVKLKESKFCKSYTNFVKTGTSHGAFGEPEVDGYYEEIFYVKFNDVTIKDSDKNLFVIELNDAILEIVEFENISKELQQILDTNSFEKVLEKEKKEYENYLKLKEKFETKK